jgi:hypothetical protein
VNRRKGSREERAECPERSVLCGRGFVRDPRPQRCAQCQHGSADRVGDFTRGHRDIASVGFARHRDGAKEFKIRPQVGALPGAAPSLRPKFEHAQEAPAPAGGILHVVIIGNDLETDREQWLVRVARHGQVARDFLSVSVDELLGRQRVAHAGEGRPFVAPDSVHERFDRNFRRTDCKRGEEPAEDFEARDSGRAVAEQIAQRFFGADIRGVGIHGQDSDE